MFKQVCTNLTDARAAELEAIFQAVCESYGITSKNDKAAFLAQMAHESGEFTIKTENMRYTTAQRIVDIWPSRFSISGGNGKKKAADYVGRPETLANEVYANRMGNGDPASGDGFRYRGGGDIQITGKESYTKYAEYKTISVEDAARLVRTDDKWAMDSAAWLYVVEKKLLGEKDFVVITKKINGGVIGLGERQKYFARALEAA